MRLNDKMTEEKKTFDPKNTMWCEKHRPQHVKDIVGDFKDKVLKYMDNIESFPHLLLFSTTPGTGKTTLGKAIINDLDTDKLVLNSSNERGIDTIREKVKEFSMTKSSRAGKRRIVLMDEIDSTTKVAMDSLRNLMETYASNVIFIMTCNNINKVTEPIRSRCLEIPFAKPKKEEVYKYLEGICIKEELDYTEQGIKKLIELNYPSIRNCVVVLQDLKTEGKKVTDEDVRPLDEAYQVLWNKIKDKNYTEVATYVLKENINTRELNKYFWHKALVEGNIKIIQLTCRNEKDMSIGAIPEVIFVTSLIEMVK